MRLPNSESTSTMGSEKMSTRAVPRAIIQAERILMRVCCSSGLSDCRSSGISSSSSDDESSGAAPVLVSAFSTSLMAVVARMFACSGAVPSARRLMSLRHPTVNSSKSMLPEASLSRSTISAATSSLVGCSPRSLRRRINSPASIVPELSRS
eukprot:Amastigsp_a842136_521.p2 type:complete len:152 gc:universal Amastigsp_a842136_521:426-881(+)